jgi:predicted amidohydrolase
MNITGNESPLRAACVQLCSGLDIDANLRHAGDLIREAADRGARYILTPENTALMDEDKARVRSLVGTMKDDRAAAHLAALAAELGIWLHVGSLALRAEEGPAGDDRLVNRSLLIGPDGRIRAWYDKIHLFDVMLGDEERAYRESAYIRPGREAVLARVAHIRLGLSICYDVRFPALYRALARAGAEAFAMPAAFTVPTGRAHWHVLLRARAIENGAWVLAAAQGGQHESGRRTYGHSLIVSPWGEVVAELNDDRPGVLCYDIDITRVKEARRRIPALEHEREFELRIRDSA